jgi:tetratricopeptide (TPR) repeat protein
VELERFDEAEALLSTALPTFRRLGIRGDEGDALRGLSRASRGRGRHAAAREFIEQALAIARERDNSAWEAHWLYEYGNVLLDLDEPDEALVAYQRAAVLHRRLGDRTREACAVDGTGVAYSRLDRGDEAAEFHRLAVTVFRELGDRWHLALALANLGDAVPGSNTEPYREALDLLAVYQDPASVRRQEEIRGRLG